MFSAEPTLPPPQHTSSIREIFESCEKISCRFSQLKKPRARHSPVIVGDHYELAETVASEYCPEHQEDLVGKAGFSAALLPMSEYAKPQDPNGNDQPVGTPSQVFSGSTNYNVRQRLMHLGNALSGVVNSPLEPPSTAYDQHNDQLNYGASAVHQPRAKLNATQSTYHDFESRKAFQVSTYNPERGNEGARVYVYLESSSDLTSLVAPTASLMFASRPVPAAWSRLEAGDQNACYSYSVYAIAPAFSETGSSKPKIPLRLLIHNQSGLDASSIYIGEWLYENSKQLEHYTPRSTGCTMPPEQQTTSSQDYGSYTYPSASLSYPPSLDFSAMQRRYTLYGRSELQQNLRNELDAMGSQDVIGGASSAQRMMRQPMSQTSMWNPSYGVGYGSSGNQQLTPAPSFQSSPIPSPSPVNPRLIRTSQVPPSIPKTGVVIDIQGNLQSISMRANWTPEERAVKRRIVRFWREQSGTTIKLYFKPLGAEERSLFHMKNEQCISCIYWEEGDECYITSVDTIYLLALMFGITLGDSKEETAEKNRIRRNLQTYKPATVSKSGVSRSGLPKSWVSKSPSFFELIMSFPDPKPSKIKKDVKVFEWSELEQALNKIVSKYTGIPASVVVDIKRRPRLNYSGAQRTAGRGRASAAYAQTPESMTLSPTTVPHGLPSYPQSSPLQQQASPASLTHSYSVSGLGSPYTPNDAFKSPYTPQVSIPSPLSAYTNSDIGPGTNSPASTTEDIITSSNDYNYSARPPYPNAYGVGGHYAVQQFCGGVSATLGLPGRASEDLAAYIGTGDAQSVGSD